MFHKIDLFMFILVLILVLLKFFILFYLCLFLFFYLCLQSICTKVYLYNNFNFMIDNHLLIMYVSVLDPIVICVNCLNVLEMFIGTILNSGIDCLRWYCFYLLYSSTINDQNFAAIVILPSLLLTVILFPFHFIRVKLGTTLNFDFVICTVIDFSPNINNAA